MDIWSNLKTAEIQNRKVIAALFVEPAQSLLFQRIKYRVLYYKMKHVLDLQKSPRQVLELLETVRKFSKETYRMERSLDYNGEDLP